MAERYEDRVVEARQSLRQRIRQSLRQRIKASFSNESFGFDLVVAVLIIIGAVIGFFLFTLFSRQE